jgi:hypothetical protein
VYCEFSSLILAVTSNCYWYLGVYELCFVRRSQISFKLIGIQFYFGRIQFHKSEINSNLMADDSTLLKINSIYTLLGMYCISICKVNMNS